MDANPLHPHPHSLPLNDYTGHRNECYLVSNYFAIFMHFMHDKSYGSDTNFFRYIHMHFHATCSLDTMIICNILL